MSGNEPQPFWRRLARRLSGEEEAGRERTDTERGADDDPADPDAREQARAVWKQTGASDPDTSRWNVEAAWRELLIRIQTEPEGAARDADVRRGAANKREGKSDEGAGTGRKVGLRRSPARGHQWGRVAAAAAAVILVGAGALYLTGPDPSADERADLYQTDRAERLEIRLPDGSQMELAPESELSVPEDFGPRQRRVELQGLAFFDVRTDEESTFEVRTAGGRVTALGTRFSVRSFPGEDSRRVVVQEGRVSLRGWSGREEVVLSAGEAGLASGEGPISVRSVDPEREISWTSGRLVFEAIPLRDVARELERWYGVEFDVGSDAVGARRFTGDFTEESIKQIADIIAASLGVDYRVRDSTLVFVEGK